MESETTYEEIDRRIGELRRDGWEWIKAGPEEPRTMCAVVDCRPVMHVDQLGYEWESTEEDTRLSETTIQRLNKWFQVYTDSDWSDITCWNDADVECGGAGSVDDVIVVLEKFRADL